MINGSDNRDRSQSNKKITCVQNICMMITGEIALERFKTESIFRRTRSRRVVL